MSSESKRLFKKPIIVGAIGWAILTFSVISSCIVWLLFPSYSTLYLCAMLFLIFLVVWTVVSMFGILQGIVDYNEFKFLKPYLAAAEIKLRNTLFRLGLITNLSLILCNSIMFFWLYKLWQKIFP